MATTAGPRVYFRTIDGLRIGCADTGGSQETAVLLTSPWPESVYAFAPIWETLAERARLFAVDLPGFGASERREDLLSPRGMGGFLVGLVEEADLGSPYLVAPDVGTAAALFAAAADPERVAGLVVGTGEHCAGALAEGGLRVPRSTSRRHWPTATSWSPTTPTPARSLARGQRHRSDSRQRPARRSGRGRGRRHSPHRRARRPRQRRRAGGAAGVGVARARRRLGQPRGDRDGGDPAAPADPRRRAGRGGDGAGRSATRRRGGGDRHVRARDRGCRARRPRRAGRRPSARGGEPVGDWRRQRPMAAHPRRQVPGRGGRRQHPRRTTQGRLRGGPARRLHRSPGSASAGRFSAMVPLSEVPKTATYTHSYAEQNGFLTLLSDGERLTGAYALGSEAGEWLQQATLAIRAHIPLDVLADTIQPFPTFSEIYVAALKKLRAAIAAAPKEVGAEPPMAS